MRHQKNHGAVDGMLFLSTGEEEAFLSPWVVQAEKGGVLTVPPIHRALMNRLGEKIPQSTTYRLLAWHGWRKVEPDTRHGSLDYCIATGMNTGNMNRFLNQIRHAHLREFIIMVLDGASSHKSKDLKIPENVVPIRLPQYSQELNPAELIWKELRKHVFADRVFDSFQAVVQQAEAGLTKMAENKTSMKNLTC